MTNLINIIEHVTDIIAALAVLAPVAMAAIRYLSARTQDKRIKVLESYAQRVVLSVEQLNNLLPSDKKALAKQKLLSYVNESKLKLKVTEEQLDDLIEAAVNIMNDSTTAGTKKESAAIYDAEKVAQLEAIEDDKLVEVVAEPNSQAAEDLITTVTD